MLFNSIDFILFLPIFFILYWYVTNKNLGTQNLLVVIASYIFYGWWDYRFLSLIFVSTMVDYSIGVALSSSEDQRKRKALLWTSIIVNLGFLGFFKYFNFFSENFAQAFTFLGYEIQSSSLDIILPVGISFYTFQTLSYTIDVYKKKLEPTKDLIAFMAFVSFFPQLVAGPIERASNLLPQFYKKRVFDAGLAVNGLRQALWGLLKKVVIADNCAEHADVFFNSYVDHSGYSLLFGSFCFTLQIYCDFSGYSDIAIGISRLFGFDLKRNFAFPYFSRDIPEFWRRWHISLSTWFRDYLYFPLGGSRGSKALQIRNTFIIFLVSGFWHGANWTFIIWGGLNALYYLPYLILGKNRKNLDIVESKYLFFPSIKDALSILLTFSLSSITWVFFRAESVGQALSYLNRLFSGILSKFELVNLYNYLYWDVGFALPILIVLFFFVEWFGRKSEFALEHLFLKHSRYIRLGFYYVLTMIIIFFMNTGSNKFIYFDF